MLSIFVGMNLFQTQSFPLIALRVLWWSCHYYTLHTFIFASLVKSFTLLSFSGKLAIFILATFVSHHYNIYEIRVKLATFRISHLSQRKWRKLVLMNAFCVQGIWNLSICVMIIEKILLLSDLTLQNTSLPNRWR